MINIKKNNTDLFNKNDNIEKCNNNINNDNANNIIEIKKNEKEYRSSRFKEKINDKNNDNSKLNKKNKKDKTVKFKEDIIKKDINIIPEESKSIINEDNYNLSLVKHLNYEKDEPIINEKTINRIKVGDNFIRKVLDECDRQIKSNDNNYNENEKIEIIFIENFKTENPNNEKEESNYLNNIEKHLIEKN